MNTQETKEPVVPKRSVLLTPDGCVYTNLMGEPISIPSDLVEKLELILTIAEKRLRDEPTAIEELRLAGIKFGAVSPDSVLDYDFRNPI